MLHERTKPVHRYPSLILKQKLAETSLLELFRVKNMVESISLLDSLTQDADELSDFDSKMTFEFEKVKIGSKFNFPESPESPPPSKKPRLSAIISQAETGCLLELEKPVFAIAAGIRENDLDDQILRDPMKIDTDSESDSEAHEKSPPKKKLKQGRILKNIKRPIH